MGLPGFDLCIYRSGGGWGPEDLGEKLLAFLTFQAAVAWLGYQSHPGRDTGRLSKTHRIACTNELIRQALLGHSKEARGKMKSQGDGARPEL